VEWDFTDEVGHLKYTVVDQDSGERYLAYHSEGWLLVPESTPTVDYERRIPDDSDFESLIIALDKASGREKIPGVRVW
jgi:hypothetical protein